MNLITQEFHLITEPSDGIILPGFFSSVSGESQTKNLSKSK